MQLNLTGRVAVVTGPAKGMGAAVTRALAAEGCRRALAGRDLAAIGPVAAAARGRFVMRDGALVAETRGHGRPVHPIRRMPRPAPRNLDQTIAAQAALRRPR